MNTQLRQCSAKIKPFCLKKSRKCSKKERISKSAFKRAKLETLPYAADMGGGTFFKVGGHKFTSKTIEHFCDLNWQL